MTVWPWDLLIAPDAPHRLTVLVIRPDIQPTSLAILRPAVKVIHRTLAFVHQTEVRNIVHVSLPGLSKTGPAKRRLPVKMIRGHFEIAFRTVGGDSPNRNDRGLAETVLARPRDQRGMAALLAQIAPRMAVAGVQAFLANFRVVADVRFTHDRAVFRALPRDFVIVSRPVLAPT